MRNQRGFSLIELLIVVAIIGIIAAIAIPNFTSSKKAANEASAIAAVRTIITAEMTYSATVGNGSFCDLAALGATDPPLIDATLAGGAKSGYNFTCTGSGDTFSVSAAPQGSTSGDRTFTAAEDGVIFADGEPLGAASGG